MAADFGGPGLKDAGHSYEQLNQHTNTLLNEPDNNYFLIAFEWAEYRQLTIAIEEREVGLTVREE